MTAGNGHRVQVDGGTADLIIDLSNPVQPGADQAVACMYCGLEARPVSEWLAGARCTRCGGTADHPPMLPGPGQVMPPGTSPNGSAPAPPWENPPAISDVQSKEQRAALVRQETLDMARRMFTRAIDAENSDKALEGMPLAVLDQVNTRIARIASDQLEAEVREASKPRAVVRSAQWLNEQTFTPLSWVVPGVIPEGVCELAGKPKCGKSWLLFALGLAAASGRPMIGNIPAQAPRPVFYLALEDSERRIKDRADTLGWPHLPDHFYCCTSADMDQALALMLEFLETYRQFRPVALVDTWGKLVGPARKGETVYDRDYRIGGAFKKITDSRPGTGIIVNQHTRKEAAADFLDSVSGTQGNAGAFDTILVLERKRGEDTGVLHVTGRDVDEDDYALAGFPHWRLNGATLADAALAAQREADTRNLGDRSSEALAYLDEHGEITTEIAANLLHTTSSDASRILDRLRAGGKIIKTGRGKWSTVPTGVFGMSGALGGLESSRHSRGYARARHRLGCGVRTRASVHIRLSGCTRPRVRLSDQAGCMRPAGWPGTVPDRAERRTEHLNRRARRQGARLARAVRGGPR